jgi:hypothetical protein
MGNFGPKIIKIGWAVQKLWPFWWVKSGWFSVFLINVKKKIHFWTKIYLFHYVIGYHAFFYCTVVYPPYASKRGITHTCRCSMKKMPQNLKPWK